MSIYLVFVGKKKSITKLIKGNDGLVRGVSLDTVVSTTNKTHCINRPLKHISSVK